MHVLSVFAVDLPDMVMLSATPLRGAAS